MREIKTAFILCGDELFALFSKLNAIRPAIIDLFCGTQIEKYDSESAYKRLEQKRLITKIDTDFSVDPILHFLLESMADAEKTERLSETDREVRLFHCENLIITAEKYEYSEDAFKITPYKNYDNFQENAEN